MAALQCGCVDVCLNGLQCEGGDVPSNGWIVLTVCHRFCTQMVSLQCGCGYVPSNCCDGVNRLSQMFARKWFLSSVGALMSVQMAGLV